MSKYIAPITFGLLSAGLFLSVIWLFKAPDFEPALTSFGLLASLMGVYVDRVLSKNEKRKSLLVVLIHELYMNAATANDKAFSPSPKKQVMFPRFVTSTLSIVIASGEFNGDGDKQLFRLMCEWVNYSLMFNKKMDGFEVWLLTKANSNDAKSIHDLITHGGLLIGARDKITALREYLIKHYKVESEIDEDTPLFSE